MLLIFIYPSNLQAIVLYLFFHIDCIDKQFMKPRKTVGHDGKDEFNDGFDLEIEKEEQTHEIEALQLELNEIEKKYTMLEKFYSNKISELYFRLTSKDHDYERLKKELEQVKLLSAEQKQKITDMQSNQVHQTSSKHQNKSPNSMRNIKQTSKKHIDLNVDNKNIKRSPVANLKGPSPKKTGFTFAKPSFSPKSSTYNLNISSPSQKSRGFLKKSNSPTNTQQAKNNISNPGSKPKKKIDQALHQSQKIIPKQQSKKGLRLFKEQI